MADFWSALGAIGTIGACAIALWQSFRPYRKRIDMAMVWGGANGFHPYLVVNNQSKKSIVIYQIVFFYDGKDIGRLNVLDDPQYADQIILEPDGSQKFEIEFHLLEPKNNMSGIYFPEELLRTGTKKRKLFRVDLWEMGGKKFSIKEQYTQIQMQNMINTTMVAHMGE